MPLFPPIETMGEERIRLTLAAEFANVTILAFSFVVIEIDYSACEPAGLVLPLELTITAPSPEGFFRSTYRRARPRSIFFRPNEGGNYLVRLAELAHNDWFGTIKIPVSGETVDHRRRLQ